MSEVLWWKKESWYESKNVPLFGFFVSPRQLIFLLSTGLVGLAMQAFIPVYWVKVMIVFVSVISGAVISSFPSNVIPWELAVLAEIVWREKKAAVPAEPRQLDLQVHRLPSNVPLAFVGEIYAEKPTDVILYVDGEERARASVTDKSPRYRLYYLPEENEKGAHEISVVAEGKTLKTLRVEVS